MGDVKGHNVYVIGLGKQTWSLKNALGFISPKREDMLFMLYNFASYNAKLRLERTLFLGEILWAKI